MMTKSRMYTIVIIVSVAILSLSATITGNVISRRELSKFPDKSGCVSDSWLQSLKDVLNNICAYDNILNVQYDVNVHCDEEMTKLQTSDPPEVTFTGNLNQGSRYTLLMVDPDAPDSSVEDLVFFLHWAAAGISVDALRTGTFPQVLIEYTEPSPPKNQLHRYQFILFEESKGNDVILQDSKRVGFKMEDFLRNNNLCVYVGAFQFKLQDVQ